MSEIEDPLMKLSIDQITEIVCREYGLPFTPGNRKANIDAIKALPEFKRSFAQLRDVGLVLKRGLRYRNQVINEGIAAFYISHVVRKGKDKKNPSGPRVVQAEGPRVLLASGDPIPIWNKQRLTEPFMGRVAVTPAEVRRDIYAAALGMASDEYIVPNDAKVEASAHEAPVPEVTLAAALQRASRVRGGKSSRGTIGGDTGDIQAFVTLTIGDRDEISYFGPNSEYAKEGDPDVVKVIARDANGEAVGLKLLAEQVQETFGLPQGAKRRDYQDALAGEPIACNGKLGIFHPRFPGDFEEGVFDAALKELIEGGCIGESWRAHPTEKRKLRALVLTGHNQRDPETGEEEQITHVRIGSLNVYDLEEVAEEGKITWKASVLAKEVGKHPWLSCIEKRSVIKSGPRAGQESIYNEGAFVVFLNQIGGRPLNEEDPFAQAAKEFTLDDIEGIAQSTSVAVRPAQD